MPLFAACGRRILGDSGRAGGQPRAFRVGGRPSAAAHHAVILEALARMAYFTLSINATAQPAASALRDKHYLRKHGKDAYYGQKKNQ